MDRHDMANASQESVAQAHLDDLGIQERYGATFLTYWFDYERQTTFCLVEAPDADTVSRVHRDAHGDVPGQVIEVEDAEVDAFLGRISDPPGAAQPIAEPAFRTILFTDIAGSTEVHDRLGDEAAMGLLRRHNAVVRAALGAHEGREVKHTGDGIMASFREPADALHAAVAMQRGFAADVEEPGLDVRIGVNAGEPVEEGNELFGLAVNLARRFCDGTDPGTIMTSDALRELTRDEGFDFQDAGERRFKGVRAPLHVCLVTWSVT
jgi:class 3 adenylate cyclase